MTLINFIDISDERQTCRFCGFDVAAGKDTCLACAFIKEEYRDSFGEFKKRLRSLRSLISSTTRVDDDE